MTSAIQRLAAASAKPRPSNGASASIGTRRAQQQAVQLVGEDYVENPSHRAQIENLLVGGTFAKAVRIDGDDASKAHLEERARALRLGMQPTVHRITKRTGQEYTIEGGEFRTRSGDLVLVIAVTRTA